MSKHAKYAESFLKFCGHLAAVHISGEKVILNYRNSTYWCELVTFKAHHSPKNFGLDLTLRITTHQRNLADDLQDAKIKLSTGKYTMLADVGEIHRKKQKNKSYHYDIELNWS